jgi:hypothetical protein
MNWIITIVARPSWTGPKFSYLHNSVNNVQKVLVLLLLLHVDGVRWCLGTVATGRLIVHPLGDIWVWGLPHKLATRPLTGPQSTVHHKSRLVGRVTCLSQSQRALHTGCARANHSPRVTADSTIG